MTDFCYSRPMMERVLRRAELMDRMMQCIGVEPARAARIDKGMAWYEARSRCIACLLDRQCRSWIESQGVKAPAPPGFCANAEFFRQAKQPTKAQLNGGRHEPTRGNMGAALAAGQAQSPDLERT